LLLNSSGKAHKGESADEPISEVNLPPSQAKPRRSWKGMMVVMPALAESERTKHEVVSALIARSEWPATP
jgi:hypothetical protein